jgi:hypothetical protein
MACQSGAYSVRVERELLVEHRDPVFNFLIYRLETEARKDKELWHSQL